MPSPTPLQALQEQVQALQQALVDASPTEVQRRAEAVRSASLALTDWLARTPAAQHASDTRDALQALGAQLSSTRDQLARVLSVTSQQAASLLPPVDPVTYGPTSSSKARIYRAPG